MTDSIAAQVAALPKTPTPELKQMWRTLYDKEPPGFSRRYLISRLAYRLQELDLWRLEAIDPRQARRAGRRARPEGGPQARDQRPGGGHAADSPMAGTEHTVTVLADGFEWHGRRYRSLSAVANAITKSGGTAGPSSA